MIGRGSAVSWVSRIADAVEWRSMDVDIAWEVIEARLGTALPADYKELCRCFGVGEFSGYVHVYGAPGGADSQMVDKLASLWRTLETHPITRDAFDPYGLYRPGGAGLIPWAVSETAVEFSWAADVEVPPQDWPVVARTEVSPWRRLPMSASECLFRVLTDVSFTEFTIADLMERPSFRPYAMESRVSTRGCAR
ncbi:SMI1/KNR4 family protein [Nocardiopsis sp. EMB25]|uniref:SMI1/KNR4 family protein n=1 Tax=Nocardiopsis sp. EMB25 TaxID=2835867 RepID=UPI0022850EFD|nr:SMI1/KNR4 family protein [Nocardiopsis sp. EMB25]MCY9783492.1 SMI1/KNR4 family protein [Nocardiopsis sp. EMB25]